MYRNSNENTKWKYPWKQDTLAKLQKFSVHTVRRVENTVSKINLSHTWYKSLLNAKVAARTWIWKGINFGLLGCLKLTSCNGEIVTYTANIDLELSTQVLWINKTLSIFIKPVDTAINNVNVQVSLW